ncbi:hypothetical protein DICPUDRAFT_85505 [Dictyostelium purpureum]|uniref:EF-hand domain-containing protein n=1 Tax=Dictyostelium purpureum TaxID=5786 RepID=F1A5Y1_DICPU|nr:uncharacterized protein DICPUDRAFT_85505 [Dictyostelium purpureum]EGC28396.1 hypothetical protein DICPUDRAFT_85505 [Dictyostelium purpureum]|eukprot:XP_003295075.1 hypothetical protein DICPUDRAFT_85505 [Dictyostelium purpureum]
MVKDIESFISHYEGIVWDLDKEATGEITLDELVTYIKSFKEIEDPKLVALTIFSSLDLNDDKKISLQEVDTHKLKMEAQIVEENIKDGIKYMLDDYDGNNDGKITWDEVFNGFRKYVRGTEICVYKTNKIFSNYDKNSDKVITTEELRNYYTKFFE